MLKKMEKLIKSVEQNSIYIKCENIKVTIFAGAAIAKNTDALAGLIDCVDNLMRISKKEKLNCAKTD
jgi:GGDEF domain-containing protein